MGKSNAIDRAALDARAGVICHDPRFPEAKAAFCAIVPRCWLDTPLNRILIADTGAMAIAITITGFSRISAEAGASLQVVIDTLVAGGLASATRVRAMIDMLAARGALTVTAHPSDGRRLVIAPTELLFESLRIWFRGVMEPVSQIFVLPAAAEIVAATPNLAERYFTAVMLRQGLDGFTIFDDWPEAQMFADRRMGYVLMLHLAGATSLQVAVSRGDLALRYGVSASHITALLGHAEAHGWMARHPHSSMVTLAPDFARRLDLWVAREIAVVGMWLEAKLSPG